MQKRNLKILITIVLAITVVVFGFMFFFNKKASETSNVPKTNFFGQFLPFLRNNQSQNTNTPVDLTGEIINQNEEQTFIPKLMQISTTPIAGFVVYEKERFVNLPTIEPTQGEGVEITEEKPIAPPTEFVTALKYVAREDGNVYQTFIDRIDPRRLSTTIIPRVYDAYFGKNGESVVMRYLKSNNITIETFLGKLPKDVLGADISDNTNIRGVFLPDNIKDVSVSLDKENFFYLVDGKEFSTGSTVDLYGEKKNLVFDSPFTEWLSFWANKDTITLTTKPASNFGGFMFVLNPNKKELNKVLSNINGLTTLMSPDGSKVLYSDNNLNLFIFNRDNNQTQQLSLRTLAEKCVWSSSNEEIYCGIPQNTPTGGYPEIWYQGEVSFNDSIWKINTYTGSNTNIANPIELANTNIDAIKLSLNEKENNLFFVNKKDSTLWKLIID